VGHGTVPGGGFESFRTVLNTFQTRSNLIRFKIDVPKFEKVEMKYGYEVFDEKNKFSYRNFSRFKGGFQLKLRFISKFESKEAGHLGSLCSLV
jgi:hypothetical protein